VVAPDSYIKGNTMNRLFYFTTFFLLFFSFQDSATACTGFAVYSTQVFYGMNFDFADVAMKFLITANGDMKTFHLAFERMFGDVGLFVKTAGMNTKGLFASCQEQHPLTVENIPEPDENNLYTFQLYETIKTSVDVKSVEKTMNSATLINLPELNLHNLFADINGAAIITEAGTEGNAVTRMDGRFMVMTNFANSLQKGKSFRDVDGKGADRYKICHEYLNDTIHDFSLNNGLELLEKACNQEPDYPTACSMVFDPQNNDVYIVLFREFKKVYKVSIEKSTIELWRGDKDQKQQPVLIGDDGVYVSDLM